MLTRKRIEELVRELVDHSYDSGYYSGAKQDGTPHHKKAIQDRESCRRQMIDLIARLASDREILLGATRDAMGAFESLSGEGIVDEHSIEPLRSAVSRIESGFAKEDVGNVPA